LDVGFPDLGLDLVLQEAGLGGFGWIWIISCFSIGIGERLVFS
jgi:hypothetical protein